MTTKFVYEGFGKELLDYIEKLQKIGQFTEPRLKQLKTVFRMFVGPKFKTDQRHINDVSDSELIESIDNKSNAYTQYSNVLGAALKLWREHEAEKKPRVQIKIPRCRESLRAYEKAIRKKAKLKKIGNQRAADLISIPSRDSTAKGARVSIAIKETKKWLIERDAFETAYTDEIAVFVDFKLNHPEGCQPLPKEVTSDETVQDNKDSIRRFISFVFYKHPNLRNDPNFCFAEAMLNKAYILEYIQDFKSGTYKPGYAVLKLAKLSAYLDAQTGLFAQLDIIAEENPEWNAPVIARYIAVKARKNRFVVNTISAAIKKAKKSFHDASEGNRNEEQIAWSKLRFIIGKDSPYGVDPLWYVDEVMRKLYQDINEDNPTKEDYYKARTLALIAVESRTPVRKTNLFAICLEEGQADELHTYIYKRKRDDKWMVSVYYARTKAKKLYEMPIEKSVNKYIECWEKLRGKLEFIDKSIKQINRNAFFRIGVESGEQSISEAFKYYLPKFFSEGINMHAFRHLVGTAGAFRGLPPQVIADMLGDEIATVMKYYQHVKKEYSADAFAESFKNAYSQTPDHKIPNKAS